MAYPARQLATSWCMETELTLGFRIESDVFYCSSFSFITTVARQKDNGTREKEILKDTKKHCGQQGESRKNNAMGCHVVGTNTRSCLHCSTATVTVSSETPDSSHPLNGRNEMLGENSPHVAKYED